MLPRIIALLITFLSSALVIQAQHQDVFSNQSGEELLNTLLANYKPATVLSFSESRDSLFGKVYAHNDSLTCVYTGYTIYLDPTQDPTTAAYMDNDPNGMNTEHTYPRSKGADTGNPKADMHHLYPTRIDVNAGRASYPFAEISDNQTDTWYFWDQSQSNIPSQDIDSYSELNKQTAFEPREDHKGNVARAMFYFYTMYEQQADEADAGYFDDQRQTLCDWHYADPVDEVEWDRTFLIAHFQDDKPNPFVLDCTLAARAYCPSYVGTSCITATDNSLQKMAPFELEQNIPNPFSGKTSISYSLREVFQVEISVFNIFGQKLTTLVDDRQAAGDYTLDFDTENFAGSINSGMLFYRIQLTNGAESYSAVRKMIRK